MHLDLSRPDPAPAELVSVAALVEEDVANLELERLGLFRRHADRGDLAEVEEAALNVRNPADTEPRRMRIALPLGVLRDAADDLGDLAERCPRPVAGDSWL